MLTLHTINLSRPQKKMFLSIFHLSRCGGAPNQSRCRSGGHHRTEDYPQPQTEGGSLCGGATSQKTKTRSVHSLLFSENYIELSIGHVLKLYLFVRFPTFSWFCVRRGERSRGQQQRTGPAPAAAITTKHPTRSPACDPSMGGCRRR